MLVFIEKNPYISVIPRCYRHSVIVHLPGIILPGGWSLRLGGCSENYTQTKTGSNTPCNTPGITRRQLTFRSPLLYPPFTSFHIHSFKYCFRDD